MSHELLLQLIAKRRFLVYIDVLSKVTGAIIRNHLPVDAAYSAFEKLKLQDLKTHLESLIPDDGDGNTHVTPDTWSPDTWSPDTWSLVIIQKALRITHAVMLFKVICDPEPDQIDAKILVLINDPWYTPGLANMTIPMAAAHILLTNIVDLENAADETDSSEEMLLY